MPGATASPDGDEKSLIMYEDLAELEKDFDDVETEMQRIQNNLTLPLYSKRQSLISQIPNFWPLVFEQAPLDIDQYVQPTDSQVLGTSLTNIVVTRFEISPELPKEQAEKGDPRSVIVKFEFSNNEWFTNKSLEKKFDFRRSKDGWTGLVSEPVRIHWKKGKDLTEGLLDAACDFFEAEKKALKGLKPEAVEKAQKDVIPKLPEYIKLTTKNEDSTTGSLSLFSWFGYRGPSISSAESAAATKKEQERRAKVKAGEKFQDEAEKMDEDEDDGEDIEEAEEYEKREIFPNGEELCISISDDLYPNALRYFTQAQEQDDLSSIDFEEGSDSDDDEVPNLTSIVKGKEDGAKPPPAKKRKT